MASKEIEYTVRDYSAVDAQIFQISERERIRTQRMKIANLGRLVILGLYIAGAIALLILISGIAYRIAFPPDVEIIERTEIIEKVIEPQKIIIQTPLGTETVNNSSENSLPSKFLGNDDLSSEVSVSSNLSTEKDENRVIGSRSVTTFTQIPSNLASFGEVTSGWNWSNIDANKPSDEYCYVTKISEAGLIRYELAIKENGQITKFNQGNIKNSGLSSSQISSLISKCRWFSN